jgi:hypothetical protein
MANKRTCGKIVYFGGGRKGGKDEGEMKGKGKEDEKGRLF